MSNSIFTLQLQDMFTGQSIIAAGGTVMVVLAGGTKKATLLDPGANFASLANPFTPTRGAVRFAVANVGSASLGSTSVDIYGTTPSGRFFIYRGAQPGNPTEIAVGGNGRRETLVMPFDIANTTANVETDTGFDFPAGALVCNPVVLNVVTAEGSRTINVGLLSSQSGGSANGLIAAASLATAGLIKPTMAGTPSIGGLLRATVASNPVPEDAAITTATRLTYTLSASTAAATGFIVVPYQLTS